MHYSAKHGIAIACRLSVCDVGGSGAYRLNGQLDTDTFALHGPKAIHLLQGEILRETRGGVGKWRAGAQKWQYL